MCLDGRQQILWTPTDIEGSTPGYLEHADESHDLESAITGLTLTHPTMSCCGQYFQAHHPPT